MTDAIDLTTEQRNQLSALLRRFLPGVAVWAYGSRVKWTARPNSDLDLVAFTTPAQSPQVAELKDALAESNLPFPVDLHVWDDVPERFREIIRKEYAVVQEAKQPEDKPSLPIEWQRHEVSKLLADGKLVVGDGYRAKNSELSRTGLPFARAGNINNGFQFAEADHFPSDALSRVGNKVSQPGDVVFTSKGTVGRFAFVREDTRRFVYSPQLCFWRSLDQALIQSRFLYYWMHGSEFFAQFKGVAGQTDMAEYVSLTDQRRMHITLPSLPEQRAIAHILGTLDDKIELNRRMNETLEAMARVLFKSWFIDFDPVRRNAVRARNQPSPRPSPSGRGHQDYRAGYDFAGLIETARALRKKQTPAEDLFWELVRDRQLIGLKFRRQHQVGDYIADFYCHEHRLVIELDGGIHSEKRKKDHKRDAWMKTQGLTVLRFPNEKLFDDPESVLAAICDAVFPSTTGRGAGGEGVVAGAAYDHLFPDSFEDSELGEIPKGWEIRSIYEIADIVYGAPFASSQFNTVGFGEPLIRIRDLADESPGVWTPEVHPKGYKVRPGDIVVGMDGEFRAYLWGGAEAWLNQRVCVFLPKGDYTAAFVRNSIIEPLAHVESTETATTVIHLGKSDIDRFCVVAPTAPVLAAFNQSCQPWYDRIVAVKREARTLAALRDALLPKLTSGELRMKGAERFIGRDA